MQEFIGHTIVIKISTNLLEMNKVFKYTWLLLILINIQLAQSQSILFSEDGLKSAFERAKTENKPVLLWCYASWCPHCKSMKETVFTDRAVAEHFNKTFICVAQNMEKGAGIKLNDSIKVSSYPTFIFYQPNGEVIYRIESEFKPAAFIAEGKNALTPKKQFPYLKQQFEKDISNSNNCYDYVRALKKGGMDLKPVLNQYFATQSDTQLLSEVNWRIIANGVTDINSREMQFVIGHLKEFSDIASPERVKRKLDYLVKDLLNSDTINYEIHRKQASQIHLYSTDSLIFTYDLLVYKSTKNWVAYRKTCLQSVEIFSWKNTTQLFNIANEFLKNITDSTALFQALRWSQRSLTLNESYDTYVLCARLYQKLNNVGDAIRMATKAKDLSTKFGWVGVEAETLLKELNTQKK